MQIEWDNTEVLLNRADRVRCEPGWQLRPGWSDHLSDFDLWIVWAGKGEMTCAGHRHSLRPGSCFWMRPGGDYSATQDASEPLGVTYIHFDLIDAASGRRVPHSVLPAEVHEIRRLAYFEAAASRVVELVRSGRLEGERRGGAGLETARHLMTALLMELDAGYGAASDVPGGNELRQRELILNLIAAIYESPGDWKDVGRMARETGYSPDHFTRVFRKVAGMSPRELVIQARMDRARQLLQESTLPVTAIAAALGYENVFFFSRQFKEKNAVTPTAFRRGDSGRLPTG